jgi:uncharacterized membrane-anchored protein YitT (DUF2179 family)
VLKNIRPLRCLAAALGSVILAFGLYHIHSFSGVTEGGVLGMTLLLERWLRISPAVSGLVLNALCFLFGWRVLGRDFVLYSAVAGGGFSLFYAVFEQFPPLWPRLASMPFAAAVLGAAFVGVGVGICVRASGAPSGDDALAMGLSRLTGLGIQWIYLASDLLVLGLSVSYLPLPRLGWSLLTVVLSGQIIGWMQKLPFRRHNAPPETK